MELGDGADSHSVSLPPARGVTGFSVLLTCHCSSHSVNFWVFPSILCLQCADVWMAPCSPQSFPWSPRTGPLPAGLPASLGHSRIHSGAQSGWLGVFLAFPSSLLSSRKLQALAASPPNNLEPISSLHSKCLCPNSAPSPSWHCSLLQNWSSWLHPHTHPTTLFPT